MKKFFAIAIATFAVTIFVSAPASAQAIFNPMTGTYSTSTGGNGQPQAIQPQSQWGSVNGGPVMDVNTGRYISEGRVENPVNRVIYDEPGRKGFYQAQTVATYGNVALGVIGALVQIAQSNRREREPVQQTQAPANSGLAQCSANGQASGVYVDNADGQGLARCNAIFNR